MAFESFMAAHLGCMLLVGGEWCDWVPSPAHSLNLRIPYIDGLAAPLFARFIADEPGAFQEFHSCIVTALTKALEARGSEAFSKEIDRIQREIIDDGVAKLDRKWKEIVNKRRARLGQYAMRTIGVTIGVHFLFSPAEHFFSRWIK